MSGGVYRQFKTQKSVFNSTKRMIAHAAEILEEYAAQGYDPTLRQIYYQFVARDLLPNTQKSYDNLGKALSTGRLLGLLPWDQITDRTRNVRGGGGWDSPESIISAVGQQYHRNLWEDQPCHVEVWVEKDALANVVERAASRLRVPYFACRGYASQSEMWAAGERLASHIREGRAVHIIHLGDHDPSGIDMTRDIYARLNMFITGEELPEGETDYGELGYDASELASIHRIALNMDQVKLYNPPPNPAKVTDSRFNAYKDQHGSESWELDALDLGVLERLIMEEVTPLIDSDLMDAAREREASEKKEVLAIGDNWEEVTAFLEEIRERDE